jgi:hypothetical protein
MKLPLLCPALALAITLPVIAVPIAIPDGGLVYTQNFNTLANAVNTGNSLTPWTDDSTLPGWWLYRAGNGTPLGFAGDAYTYRVSNGATSMNGGEFFSLGDAGSTERALGNPSSTAQGELSAIVIFQNTGTLTQELTRIRHNVEVRRSNQNANLLETLFVWSKLGASAEEILTLTTAPATAAVFPAGVATTPGSHYITGWDRRAEAEVSYAGTPVGFTQVNQLLPVNAVPSSPVRIAPGQFFAMRYSNINDIGTDHQMGIDDVQLTFTPLSINLAPAVSGVVRHDSGTPRDPADDTVDFTLTVEGTGSVSPAGWTVNSPGTLAGLTGTYGVPRPFTGIPIADFSAAQHTLDVIVGDFGTPGAQATAMVTAPWCTLSAVVTNVIRHDNGTLAAIDDTWDYTVTVDGTFTGTGWTSDNGSLPSGAYGVPFTVTGLPAAIPSDSVIFTDNADTACTVTVTAPVPRILGSVSLGTDRPLFSDADGVPGPWSVDEAAPTQTLANGGGAPAKAYRSEVLDLTAVGAVKFTGSLLVNDDSSGCEPADSFNARLIIDGDAANPVSLITAYDTIIPANGVLTGAEITPANPGPPPVSGEGDFTHRFLAVIPESANSVQLVISANNDSTSETFTVQELRFALATHSLEAIAAAGVQFDNKGTVTADDDEFSQPVIITPVIPPPGSTGWTSNSNPAAGLFTDVNPVLFGPFLMSAGPQVIDLADNGVPAVTSSVSVPVPVPALTANFVAGSGILIANGPGVEDDAASFDATISAPVGSTEFRVYADYPVTASVSSNALSPAVNTVTITLERIPDHGPVYIYFEDAGYPDSVAVVTLTFGNTVTDTSWILGKKNTGTGLTSVFTRAGSVLPPDWQNYPAVPAVGMNGGVSISPQVITSEVIDLTGVSGEVRFTANLHVVDIGTGFESDDTFKAELILDGNTASPVNLIAPYDADSSGVMNGGETAAEDEFNADKLQDGGFTGDFPLAFTIPDSVTSVQLVITGLNDSLTEAWVLENCLFATAGTPAADTDGDGIGDDDEVIMGTDPNDDSSFTRLAQTEGFPTEFSFLGIEGRFYRIYQSDDADPASHLAKWTDTGIGAAGAGVHALYVAIQPGVTRRLYRVHVMQTDGPWPALSP